MNFNFSRFYFDVKAKKPVILSTNHRYIDLWGGRARGASHAGSDSFLFALVTEPYFRGYIMRQVFNDIRDSIWKDLMDRVQESEISTSLFHINENEMTLKYIPNGNQIIAKAFKKQTGTQTGKLKSLAGATHVLIEEADEINRHDFDKLDDSVRTKKNPNVKVIRIFNSPPKSHWIIEDWYDLESAKGYPDYFIATPKNKEGFLSIFSTYKNNYENIAASTLKKIEWYGQQKPGSFQHEHYLTDYLGLIAPGNKGRIYKEYELFDELPDLSFYRVFAQDWGGNDPNALIQMDFDKRTMSVYLTEIMYVSEIKNVEMIDIVKRANPGNHEVVCDSARKDRIYEYQVAGINAFGVKKGTIIDDIDLVKEWKLFVHKDSANLRFELENYTWKFDDVNKVPLNIPIDKYNHCLDSIKYGVKYYHMNFIY